MDARTKLRLLMGPVRPFIWGKVRDAWLRPRLIAKARTLLPTPLGAAPTLRRVVCPLPTQTWLEDHGRDVSAYAARMAAGQFAAFGIDTWDRAHCSVISPDPRGVLEFARQHQVPAYAVAALRDRGHVGEHGAWFDEFQRDLNTFREFHPPLHGPMWSVAMDCGIRLYNILLAWDWFGQLGYRTDELDAIVAATARDHAVYLQAALETSGGMGTSHLLGGLLGLLAYEAYAGHGSEVCASFVNAVDRQILSDGMDFEASTGYHRQVVDILVQADVLIRHSPHLLEGATPTFWTKVERAQRALRELERAGMPLIGDNDDGVVLRFGGIGLGERNPGADFVAFAEFGLWIWHRDGAVLTARNGPVGQYGKGGHAHNDQNSITLRINDQPIIIDPGTFCYVSDPARRNFDRSTAAHATVDLGIEQAWWPNDLSEGLFWMIQEGEKPHVDIATDTSWRGHVRHGGSPLHAHVRTLEIGDHRLEVRDSVHVDGARGTIVIPFGPKVHVEVAESSAQLTVNDRAVRITWTNASAELTTMNSAPAYYVNQSSQRLLLHMHDDVATWSVTW